MMHRQVQGPAPSQSSALSESNAPSDTTEARSRAEREKELAELMQRPVDPALLTVSRSSGPAVHRARPGKQDKSKKVQFISVISCDWAQHNTCTCNAGIQSSSSSTAGASSRRKTSSSTRLQPAGGQARKAEVREGRDSIYCNLGIFGNILKFWEHLGNSEIDTWSQNTGTWRSRHPGTYTDTFKNNFSEAWLVIRILPPK
jgi:hypothetical protein